MFHLSTRRGTDPCSLADAPVVLDNVILNPDLTWAFDPDVLGFVVRLSTYVMNICAAILIRWGSRKDAEAAIQGTLIQISSIVLCTLISLGRGQLTFFDGQFTLTVSRSPIAWYLLWISLRQIYRRTRGEAAICCASSHTQYQQIHMNTVLCFAIVGGWISLNLVVWFKGRKFPGDDCGTMSFKTYFVSVVLRGSLPGLSGIGGLRYTNALGGFLAVCLSVYVRRNGALAHRNNLGNFGTGINRIFRLTRFTLNHHKWLIYTPVIYSYISWSGQLVLWWVEPGYNFTYGQSLSAMSAVPSVLLVLKLLRSLKKEDVTRVMTVFVSDIIFLLVGNGEWAASINRRHFRKKLLLPPTTWELHPLPITRPSTTAISTRPDATLGTDAEGTPAAVPSGHVSLDLADAPMEVLLEAPSPTAGSIDARLTWQFPSTADAEVDEIPRSASPMEISLLELWSLARGLADEAVPPEDEIVRLAETSGTGGTDRREMLMRKRTTGSTNEGLAVDC
ncbi:hypothetical protein DFH09DRAFT_1193103 [Mycena vulgaris]|nr:hypothetical protein DFH09DRAFT_1193103 [Mycena vulgaris]